MTNWLPDLTLGTGPLYLRLANHIETDIDTGAIAHGAKLPPQRDLAFDLKTTVGTIGRAYAVLPERGLVSGEVGRGTYVTTPSRSAQPQPEPALNAGHFAPLPAFVQQAAGSLQAIYLLAMEQARRQIAERRARAAAAKAEAHRWN